MSQETEQKIVIDYNGNLASRMSWDEGKLKEFVRRSDFRSDILIKAGNETPRQYTENLGEVLAWKKMLDPRLLISPRDDLDFEVISQYPTPKYVINVNHHILTEKVRSQSDNKFNEGLFMKKFNSSVRGGLEIALAREKTITFIGGIMATGTYVGMSAAVGLPAFYFSKESVSNFIYGHNPALGLLQLLAGTSLFLVNVSIITLAKDLDDDLKSDDPALQSLKPYINSVWDFNPLKPLGGFLRGNLYLASAGKEIVKII